MKYVALSLLALFVVSQAGLAADQSLQITLKGGDKSRVEVRGWSQRELAALRKTKPNDERLQAALAVYVVSDEVEADGAESANEKNADVENAVAVFGTRRARGDALVFEPRYPFLAGIGYRVVVRREALAESPGTAAKSVSRVFKIPRPKRTPSTVVAEVYPTTDVLPENQLKFYLHFSAPMSRGDVYRHMHLLKADGSEVDLPFLELAEELWDASGKRLTVLFDPGRIKRGLKPREEVGPVLEEGRSYTFVIDRDWKDAQGQPLVREYRKTFKAAPPDDTQPDPKRWKIAAPAAGSREPLEVVFGEPLDEAMLQHVIAVRGSDGKFLDGKVAVDRHETRWRFTPAAAWKPGRCELVIAATLEDRAGNSIARPFEVDVFDKVDRSITTPTVTLPFEIRAGKRDGSP